MTETLDTEEIGERLVEYEGWTQEGPWLSKLYEFDDFEEAIGFVNDVAEIAEDLNHHPEILVQNYNQVALTVTTHDAGGITEKDFAFVDDVETVL